jgi:hypothetical protein
MKIILFDDKNNGKTPRTQAVETIVINGVIQVTSQTNGETSIPKGGFYPSGKGDEADWRCYKISILGYLYQLKRPSFLKLGTWKNG